MDGRRTIDPPPRLFGRRGFLTGTGATLLYTALAPLALSRFACAQRLGDDPFTLGIASGDPTADGVVLWTRLAPSPLEGAACRRIRSPCSGVSRPTNAWIVSSSAARCRRSRARPLGPCRSRGLDPSRWYWYRFKVGNEVSPIGRTRTAPALSRPTRCSFAFVSCQHYAQASTTPTGILPRKTSTSPCILATTSTKAARPAPSAVRTCPTSRSLDRGLSDPLRGLQVGSDLQAVHAAFPGS